MSPLQRPRSARTCLAWLRVLLLFSPLLFAASCESDGYDTGDGTLSYMRADFVEAYTDGDSNIEYVITDDDELLTLASPAAVSWMTVADTMYRALLYYDILTLEPITVSSVSVPSIVMYDDVVADSYSALEDIPTDPLYWDSSWISSNGRYINLGMTLMLGAEDGEIGTQSLGMVCTDVTTDDDGTTVISLLLVHDQNDVPQYYSQRFYVSIPVSYLPCTTQEGDRVILTVNTYDGEQTKEFEL